MLHVHRAERADGLVEALGGLLADPPDDPFARDVVAVPTRGMERWLTQRLSARLGARSGRADGVCANVDFPFPQRLVGDAVAVACGIDPDDDPWRPERAVWPLLEVVDASLAEPWLERLARHVEGEAARRFSSARHIAGLFDGYALNRPDLLAAWARGDDGGVREDSRWQAELWRRLRERIPAPDPVARRADAVDRIEADPALLPLPQRVALFGLTRLPAGHLQVLSALAAARDVHLFLLHPSPALWAKIAPANPGVVARDDDPSANLPANRLLESWGRDSRELQLVLGAAGDQVHHHHEVEHAQGTLLARLQADVRADRAPSRDDRPLVADDDDSLRIHSCHGRARQVEVVRDALLHLLEEDPTLEPRDIIVMCPDIETFAPLIQATFDAGEIIEGDEDATALPEDVRPPDLRVRLADRSLRQTNPVLGVVAVLLDLAGERVTASQVLDLAGREPVRRRFNLDDDDLSRIQQWVAQSGIRWGLDAEHRAPFKLDGLDAGTWRFGLDRMLVGVTMSEDEPRLFGEVLPLDDVASNAVDVAGRFAELVDRLAAVLDDLRTPRPVTAWARALGEAADLLTATAPRDAWQRAQLQRILEDAATEAASGAVPIAPAELRALLAERLEGRPTRANFRTGHLTICTLHPMRSVPHRVVCLLGLDDGAFPRKSPRDGDDLALDSPHVGDRDPRSEDRQLLLDALLAAREKLIVTYTGKDERTNEERPPAVPVGELLDMVERTVEIPEGARKRIVVPHPLQPFDPKNFTAGELVPGPPWSFDTVTLDGARALCDDRPPRPAFLPAPLDGDGEVGSLVELDALIRFVEHPVRAFLAQRLDIDLRDFSEDVADALPVELDNLETWDVGDRLLQGVLGGAAFDACAVAEKARGTLPPGLLGDAVLHDIRPAVEDIARAAAVLPGGGTSAGLLEVRVDVGGRTLSGTVRGIEGDVLRAITYSRVAPKQRLAMWVRWLAVTAAHPERGVEAYIVGRRRSGGADGASVTLVALRPPEGSAEDRRAFALEHLATLLDIHARGLREPPPIACKASAAYARAPAAKRREAARREWETDWGYDKEDRDAEHQLVFGGPRTFDDLYGEPPHADESGPDWDVEEPSRFGRYALRLWRGPLATEEVKDR